MDCLRLLLLLLICTSTKGQAHQKRALQPTHEKPQAEKWMESFFGRSTDFDQTASLVSLIATVAKDYLSTCKPIILYDESVEKSDGLLLEQMFRSFPIAYVHGQITNNYTIKEQGVLENVENTCIAYVMFVADVMRCKDVIGEQSSNKVVVVARSSQWRVYEFLASDVAKVFVNLLVIAQSEKLVTVGRELPFILYTHKMYIDGLGSSLPVVLTSWKGSNFSRPDVDLFPRKMTDGFAGHRFIISLAHQPPYAIKRSTTGEDFFWDGLEVRLVSMLGEIYNFTTDFREAKDVNILGTGNAVTKEVADKKTNLGIGGIYVTLDRTSRVDVSTSHSQDCAAFITLASTALPRYRAIMGPFHWSVWLSLTAIYLFAIIPLALSDKHTLRHLIDKPEEMENMFWYVFGTFTNCFTFTGEASWSKSEKVTTRVLVGFYWLFTIITTACYTGSIIAFVTLPIFPETVDTTEQLISGRFQLGTLNKGGWEYWFNNSTDPSDRRLLRKLEYLPNVPAGLKNVTKAFFWPYAFLGSRDELDYIIRTNFTTQSKRAVLHISDQCFAPFRVSLLYSKNAVYKEVFNHGILLMVQSGLLKKLKRDLEWDIMRSPTGKYLQANVAQNTVKLKVEDRALTLDDTQGMFLLLGLGFLLGTASLLSEWLGGCVNFCKKKMRRRSTSSIESAARCHATPTPRDKLNSLPYSIKMQSIDEDVSLKSNSTRSESLRSNSTGYDAEIDRIFEDVGLKSGEESEHETGFHGGLKRGNIESVFGEEEEVDEVDTKSELIDGNENE